MKKHYFTPEPELFILLSSKALLFVLVFSFPIVFVASCGVSATFLFLFGLQVTVGSDSRKHPSE